MQNARTLLNIWRRLTGEPDDDEIDAARDARLCGAMESTGILCSGVETGGLEDRKLRTSVCDCSVINTDSADVMQPLYFKSMVKRGSYKY